MPCRIFLDLEATCLDPASGHILEIGVLAVSPDAPDYTEVAAQSWVIDPGVFELDAFTLEMHTKSGLLDDIRAGRGVSLATAEAELLKFLAFFGNPAPGREPIAGSSPHFDYRWLTHHLPKVAGYFNNHRCFDASTLKRFVKDHGHAWTMDEHEGSGGAAHRALADVRYSAASCREAARLLGFRV